MLAQNSVTTYSAVQDSPVLGLHRSQTSSMSFLPFEDLECYMLWSQPPAMPISPIMSNGETSRVKDLDRVLQ